MRNLHNRHSIEMLGESEGSVWRNIPDFLRNVS